MHLTQVWCGNLNLQVTNTESGPFSEVWDIKQLNLLIEQYLHIHRFLRVLYNMLNSAETECGTDLYFFSLQWHFGNLFKIWKAADRLNFYTFIYLYIFNQVSDVFTVRATPADKQSVPWRPCGLNPPALLRYWLCASALPWPYLDPRSSTGRTLTVTDISLDIHNTRELHAGVHVPIDIDAEYYMLKKIILTELVLKQSIKHHNVFFIKALLVFKVSTLKGTKSWKTKLISFVNH